MKFHPLSEIFPLMNGAPFSELCADIKANGLREEIWTFDDQIIDGRNRFNACTEVGVEPRFREWEGNESELTKFIISFNLHRRHLSESQRAMIGAKIATWPTGTAKAKSQRQEISCRSLTVAEAGAMLNVSDDIVRGAKKVRRECVPEVVQAVEQGEITVHAAEKLASVPKDKQVTEMKRQKLLKGKRPRKVKSTMSMNGSKCKNHDQDAEEKAGLIESTANGNSTHITFAVQLGSDPESEAARIIELFSLDYVERLVSELTAYASRARAAIARGLGPAQSKGG